MLLPVLLLIFAQDLSHRGPIRIQQDLLKLIAMSNHASSLSHACKRCSSWLTEGDSIKMSSAYNIIQQPLNEETNLLRSSKYKANTKSESTVQYSLPDTKVNFKSWRPIQYHERSFYHARCWYSNSVYPSVRLSVCLSARDVPVSDENGLTYRHNFFSPYGSPITLVLPASNIFTEFRRGHPLRGR